MTVSIADSVSANRVQNAAPAGNSRRASRDSRRVPRRQPEGNSRRSSPSSLRFATLQPRRRRSRGLPRPHLKKHRLARARFRQSQVRQGRCRSSTQTRKCQRARPLHAPGLIEGPGPAPRNGPSRGVPTWGLGRSDWPVSHSLLHLGEFRYELDNAPRRGEDPFCSRAYAKWRQSRAL